MESIFDKITGKSETSNRAQQGVSDFLKNIKDNKGQFIAAFICGPILGIFLSGWIVQLFQDMFGQTDQISFIRCFTAWFTPMGIILAIIIAFFFFVLTYRISRILEKNYYIDEENPEVKIAKEGIYGNAHWMTEKERQETFIRDKDINNITGNILGKDKHGYLYTLRPDFFVPNQHELVFGLSGIGKSATFLRNKLVQCMRRGESMIVTDTKGDLYREFAQKFKDEGYIVKILNVNPRQLKHSDAFQPFKYLANGDVTEAQTLATIIIENTAGGHMDYWEKNELNCYMALMLYLSTNEAIKAAGKNTLAEMYNIASTTNPRQLATMFNTLPATHPAKRCYNIFSNTEEKNQGQILNGMGIKLNFLADENAQQILSHDEIDLVLPMKRKCIYFVVIPDTQKTDINVIATLFFALSFMRQVDYYDSRTTEQRKKVVPVSYLMDEFYSTGVIPNFGNIVSTVRSRKIKLTSIIQSYSQLEELFEPAGAVTIAGQFAVQMLLRAGEGDEPTAKYWNRLCGTQSRLTNGSRYSDWKTDIVHSHNYETVTEGIQKADLLSITDCYKLESDRLIVHISGCEPIKLYKYFSDENPFIDLDNWKECLPSKHKPKWRHDTEKALKQSGYKKSSDKSSGADDGIIQPDGYEEPFDPETGEIVADKKREKERKIKKLDLDEEQKVFIAKV